MISRLRRWWRIHIKANECEECASRGIDEVPGTWHGIVYLTPREYSRLFSRPWITLTSSVPVFEWVWLCAESARRLGVSEPERDDR